MTNLGDPYTQHELLVSRVFDRLGSNIRRSIMSAADQAANAAADQLVKAKAEIDGVLAELEDQAVRPETLERLKNLSQSFDDIVPDAEPEPEPEPEPTPDPEPTPEPEPSPEA